MKRLLVACLFIVVIQTDLLACLNHVSMNKEGVPQQYSSDIPHALPYIQESFKTRGDEFYAAWQKSHKLDDYSGYGVMLVYQGEYEKAKEIFLEIEKTAPGGYANAANLGTVYELLGENKLALEWIKKAVSINPASHEGSEWLHVKILEAKIGGPSYINAMFLTGVDFGTDSVPKTKMDFTALEKLKKHLVYQLSERMNFIHSNDKIMALLFFQLGNIEAMTRNVNAARIIYDQAREYGYHSKTLELRYRVFERMYGADKIRPDGRVARYKKYVLPPKLPGIIAVANGRQRDMFWYFTGAGIAGVSALGLVFWYRKRRKVKLG